MTTLARLHRWYAEQCDGDWEHQRGVEIGTLDNPGWRVVLDLEDTILEKVAFAEISTLDPETDWMRCWVEKSRFHGAGGPRMLEAILVHFLDWAEGVASTG